ncbi:hypothetical protein [Paenibacillus brasilensis]|nr:hypothetical protein [Paenibacillus brasilensis]
MISLVNDEEIVLSLQKPALWNRRKLELVQWIERPKLKFAPKRTAFFHGCVIDAELYGTLCLLNRKHVATEFSCAGVSIWDEPEGHSLYAYITMKADERSGAFVQWAMRYMEHRLLVVYEPERNHYDLSSFFLGHNRSFCQLMEYCACSFEFETKTT